MEKMHNSVNLNFKYVTVTVEIATQHFTFVLIVAGKSKHRLIY